MDQSPLNIFNNDEYKPLVEKYLCVDHSLNIDWVLKLEEKMRNIHSVE